MTDSLPEIARLRDLAFGYNEEGWESCGASSAVKLSAAEQAVRGADARARREERERLAEAKQEAPQVWDVQRQEFRSPAELGEPK